MPTMRPIIAPIQSDGIYKPAGTLMPIVKTVITHLKIRANANIQRARYTPGPVSALSTAELASVKLRL